MRWLVSIAASIVRSTNPMKMTEYISSAATWLTRLICWLGIFSFIVMWAGGLFTHGGDIFGICGWISIACLFPAIPLFPVNLIIYYFARNSDHWRAIILNFAFLAL